LAPAAHPLEVLIPGFRTGKEHPVDVAVIATGYDVVSEPRRTLFLPGSSPAQTYPEFQTASMLDLTGKDWVHLSDSLLKEDGPGAYRGVSLLIRHTRT
jgi:hypothetical protein